MKRWAIVIVLLALVLAGVLLRRRAEVPPAAPPPRELSSAPAPAPPNAPGSAPGVAEAPALATLPEPTPEPTPGPSPALPEQAATKPAHRLSGRVVSAATGEPIAGAQVEQLGTRRGEPDGPPLETTTTDAAGDYVLMVRTGNVGGTAVAARAQGYAAAARYLDDEGELMPTLDFALRPGGTIRGTVTDEAGSPIAGAEVGGRFLQEPMVSGPDGTEYASVATGRTRSGDDGTFLLEGLPVGAELRLPVSAEGFLSTLSPPIRVGEENVRITLLRGDATLDGVVYLGPGTDQPMEGVWVVVYPTASAKTGSYLELQGAARRFTTDAQGRFSARIASGIAHTVYARTDEGGLDRLEPAQVTLTPGESGTLAIHMKEVGIFPIRGRVYAADSKEPIPGARVRASNLPDAYGRVEDTSDTQGRYELRIIGEVGGEVFSAVLVIQPPPGWIIAPGVHAHVSVDLSAPGNSGEFDFPLRPAWTMPGIAVRGKERVPVPGVKIRLEDADAERPVVTGADGRFLLPVPRKSPFTLEATGDGVSVRRQFEGFDTPDIPEQVIVLESLGSIRGVIVDEDGLPLEGAVLNTSRYDANGFVTSLHSTHPKGSDAQGRFLIDNLPEGQHVLSLPWVFQDGEWSERYRLADAPKVTLRGGEHVEGLRLVAALAGFLEGIVKDTEGRPIAGAELQAHLDDPGESSGGIWVESGADGSFRLDGIPAGARGLSIVASKRGYRMAGVRVESIFDGPVEIVLRAVKPYWIRAVDRDSGAPVTRYQWRPGWRYGNISASWRRVEDPEGKSPVQNTELSADFIEVREIGPDGIATGRVGERGLERNLEDRTFRTVHDEEILVQVSGPVAVAGSVQLPDGRPAPGATVVAAMPRDDYFHHDPQSEGDRTLGRAVTDREGRFRIELTSGRPVVLTATHGALRVRSATIEAGSAESRAVILRLLEGGAIHVTVEDETGGRLAAVPLELHRQPTGQPPRTAETGPDGTATFTGLEDGTWIVHVQQRETGLSTTCMVTTQHTREEVRIVLPSTIRVSGRVTVNGGPVPERFQNLYFTSSEDVSTMPRMTYTAELSPDGTFVVSLPPGREMTADLAQRHPHSNSVTLPVTTPRRTGEFLALNFSAGEVRIRGWEALAEPYGGIHSVALSITDGRRSRSFWGLPADPGTGDSVPVLLSAGTYDIRLSPLQRAPSPNDPKAVGVEVLPGATLLLELAPGGGEKLPGVSG